MEYGKNTKLKDFGMVSHLSGEKEYQLINTGIIDCESHICKEKVIVQQIVTPVLSDHGGYKEFGEAKEYWFLQENKDIEFNNVQDLAKHYKLP